MSEQPSHAQWTREEYVATVKRTAAMLRDSIDRFERTALDFRGKDVGLSMDGFKATYAASRAVNELHWGIANAHVDSMLIDAATADVATRDESR